MDVFSPKDYEDDDENDKANNLVNIITKIIKYDGSVGSLLLISFEPPWFMFWLIFRVEAVNKRVNFNTICLVELLSVRMMKYGKEGSEQGIVQKNVVLFEWVKLVKWETKDWTYFRFTEPFFEVVFKEGQIRRIIMVV